jgi:DNA-binding response OmpR family regulator
MAAAEPGASETAATLLVVEDDRALADSLARILAARGYAPVVARDGQQALAALAREPIDLVLLDLGLPDIDGLELCPRIRAHPTEVYLPILMLTGMTALEQRLAGFAAGADDYLAKPFRLDELLARVGVWLNARRRLSASLAALREEHAQHLAAETRAAQTAAALSVARTVPHRINQPLAEILGYAELIETRELPESLLREYVQRIAAASRTIAAITHRFASMDTYDPVHYGGASAQALVRLGDEPSSSGPAAPESRPNT